jgi:hypothetical protein
VSKSLLSSGVEPFKKINAIIYELEPGLGRQAVLFWISLPENVYTVKC